jgi:signal transduction histidine kinase
MAQVDKNLKKLGEFGYVNQNCWLAKSLGYPPTKRCQYCQSRFGECLFTRYLIVSIVLIAIIVFAVYILEGLVSKGVIISVFALVIVYGYFFDKSTEKIIEANFEQKKAKDALEKLNCELEAKIKEQTRHIREAYEVERRAHEELEKMNESKNQFMAITQHHLRTPLSSTMGYLDLILTNTFGKVPKKIAEILVKIKGATQGEIKIVNDLLDISAFQMGKNVLQAEDDVDLEQMIKEIFDSQAIEMKERGLYSKIDTEGDIPLIFADKSKLTPALANIIDNAIKYTKEGGITTTLKSENGKVFIFIKDTGMGISKECLGKLFSSTFERCSDAQKAFAVGKGIGLFLSSKVVELHGGKIWAESEGVGKGTTFCIELPIKNVK